LLKLYEHLSAQVAATELAAAIRDWAGLELQLPHGMQGAVQIRNRFAHGDSMRFDEMRSKAGEFLRQVESFASELGDTSVMVRPQWIRVDQVLTDKWDRRVVDITDEHAQKHRMYTDEPVTVARTYLMLQRSNPLYVDPLLSLVEL
jgi:hypothetical protein